jgi:hypothetical protein
MLAPVLPAAWASLGNMPNFRDGSFSGYKTRMGDDGPGVTSLCHEAGILQPVGFEPTTYGSEDRCSIQLSYGCMIIISRSNGSDGRSVPREVSSPIPAGKEKVFGTIPWRRADRLAPRNLHLRVSDKTSKRGNRRGGTLLARRTRGAGKGSLRCFLCSQSNSRYPSRLWG